MKKRSGLLITGTHSGVGKTTVMLALLEALTRRGMRVQAFKVGPDYLDPTFHRVVTGRPSRNLDGWMMRCSEVLKSFARASDDAELSIIEGVMGLFDGLRGRSEEGSSAQIAKWLSMPVILVIDAGGLARTAAALVRGCQALDPELKISGVIFNRIGSKNHLDILREAVESACAVPVLGGFPKEEGIALPERHLGLVRAAESLTPSIRGRLAEMAETFLNLDELVKMGDSMAEIPLLPSIPQEKKPVRCRIGVALDAAFHFYYQDNLDLLQGAGAELVFFSPLNETEIPVDLDGLYFGGGYPEVYAEGLSKNQPMIGSIRKFAAGGGPIYAECGGLMYLANRIETVEEVSFPMVGLLPGRIRMGKKLKALGYREVEAQEDCLLLQKGEKARGHEFHYSEWMDDSLRESFNGLRKPYHLFRGGERSGWREEGFSHDHLLASYVHLHFASNPNIPVRWISLCEAFRRRIDRSEGTR
ncbi:MAG: cobyrinate a,c-diamide synthase [Candidatus Manganitrophaceae bacterium]|nr:MAG: cobyrinate a,c-diamide synthase [Candidatus Manganitrophaceae bacterium]